ncbi:MAG: hypothetical protein ABJA66_10270 [Actinomycetota bacterium]
MLNGNHKNSGCGFSEKLISYLYNESVGTEKVEFEAHLKKCSGCADEFADFSGVHFSINDWKLKEFALLETPIIEIPYEKHEKPVEVSSLKGSWLSGLRNLFALSPAWSLATASLVVLVVCVGIGLMILNSRQPNEVAGTDKNQSKPTISPTAEKTPPQSNTNVIENNSPNKQPKPIDAPKPSQPEVAVSNSTNSTNNRVVKVSTGNQRPIQKPGNIRNNEVKDTNKNQKIQQKAVEDDEEDNTLRLAELFDEIDTK